ncbi:hypothetical protein H4Q26_015283 [Puccinia striiformis f. sp. tritici PST-130]|nr:hypothetical protein H4Q26_015283 [Puccinia striiformis f. sp. tritici PST-130]
MKAPLRDSERYRTPNQDASIGSMAASRNVPWREASSSPLQHQSTIEKLGFSPEDLARKDNPNSNAEQSSQSESSTKKVMLHVEDHTLGQHLDQASTNDDIILKGLKFDRKSIEAENISAEDKIIRDYIYDLMKPPTGLVTLKYDEAYKVFEKFTHNVGTRVRKVRAGTEHRNKKNARRARMIQASNALWKNRDLWYTFWERRGIVDRGPRIFAEGLSTLSLVHRAFPVFLFYVDMIDTIIIPPKILSSERGSKVNLFQEAIKCFEDFTLLSAKQYGKHKAQSSKMIKNERQVNRFGKARVRNPRINQLIWDYLEFWIHHSNKKYLKTLFSGEEGKLEGKVPGFKAMFNDIFYCSIDNLNRRLSEAFKSVHPH